MPPQAKAKSAGASGSACDFEALTDEEVHFCWLSLVEDTKLSVSRLQEFMEVVCGEKLSAVQAKDLLKYMDANEDGVVGREDFMNFMCTGRLKDTNAKDFMWTPKRKYREEHGTAKQSKDEDVFSGNLPGFLGARASTLDMEPVRRTSLEIPSAAIAELGAARSSLTSHESKEPRPPRGKKPQHSAASGRPTRAEAAKLEKEAYEALNLEPAKQEKEKAKPSSSTKVDAKVKAQIDASISKYEQQSWQKFLEMEDGFKERLFKQFASDPDGMEVTEYHRMLMKLHKLAKWCMPGDLRAGDSLAALKYILDAERRAQREKPGGNGPEEDDAVMPPDARLTYKMWKDLMSGCYRPEEHHVKT